MMKGFFLSKLIILMLAFSFFIRPIAHSYIGSPEIEKSQTTAKRYLRKVHASLWAWLDPTTHNGLTSSFISNLRRLPKSKLKKSGYRELYLKTSDNKLSKAYIKVEKEKRPLLILVAGLSSPADANYFSHYALPVNKYFGFHVAMIENSTNAKWTKRNKTIQSSGHEAGWDLYLKLKELKNHPDIFPYVSETHIIGISLGGSDAAFASYFDSVMKTSVIDGAILNISSPADRLNSLKELRETKGPTAIAVNEMFRRTYGDGKAYQKYTDRDYYWIFWGGEFSDVMNEVYLKAANEYFYNHPYHFDVMKGLDEPLFKSSIKKDHLGFKELVEMFNLENYLDEIDRPILWIEANDDPVVHYETNALYVKRFKSKIFDVYETDNGGHAGFPQAYGGVWVMEHILKYIQYWGKFNESYYTQWKRPYEHKFYFSRYLKNW